MTAKIWLAKFDPSADFVWRRKTKFNGDICRPGDPVDKTHFDERTLRRFYEQRRITRSDDLKAPAAVETTTPPQETSMAALAPNMTDLMVAPEEIDRFVAENPPPFPVDITSSGSNVHLAPPAEEVAPDANWENPKGLLMSADGETHPDQESAPTYTLEVNGAWAQILKDGEPDGPKMRKKAAEAKLEELTNARPSDS